MEVKKPKKLVIYQAKSGAIELRGDFERETIWATQAQIADVFVAERSVITKHIRNILKDKELSANSVCANFAHTAAHTLCAYRAHDSRRRKRSDTQREDCAADSQSHLTKIKGLNAV